MAKKVTGLHGLPVLTVPDTFDFGKMYHVHLAYSVKYGETTYNPGEGVYLRGYVAQALREAILDARIVAET